MSYGWRVQQQAAQAAMRKTASRLQPASDERLAEAAQPALAIVLVGLLPILLLSWQMTRGRQSTVHPEL
jgi:ABC-type Fe3+ transport system permease subunit